MYKAITNTPYCLNAVCKMRIYPSEFLPNPADMTGDAVIRIDVLEILNMLIDLVLLKNDVWVCCQ